MIPVALTKNKLLRKVYFNQNELDRKLLISCSFSCAMVVARVVYTGEWRFVFLLWNLFLAALPYAITTLLQRKIEWIESSKRFAVLSICWLLLLPNAFYILT